MWPFFFDRPAHRHVKVDRRLISAPNLRQDKLSIPPQADHEVPDRFFVARRKSLTKPCAPPQAQPVAPHEARLPPVTRSKRGDPRAS